MFDNYTIEECSKKPCNNREFAYEDSEDEIVIGADAVHVFHLDFILDDDEDFRVTYTQSLSKVLTKGRFANEHGIEIRQNERGTIIIVKLSPEETSMFVENRATKAQLKLFLNTGDVIVGEENKIHVSKPLDRYEEAIEEEAK